MNIHIIIIHQRERKMLAWKLYAMFEKNKNKRKEEK